MVSPWGSMASTYAWVVEQEILRLDKQNKKTKRWVLQQQNIDEDHGTYWQGRTPLRARADVYYYEAEAEQWMRQQEAARRIAAERERVKARLIQAELRRIEERVRLRREAEKRRVVDERARILAELREQEEKLRKLRGQRMSADIWEKYETRWSELTASSEPLSFSDIPWPIASSSPNRDNMTAEAIKQFLLSACHSKDVSHKDRIRNALRRWHPDRFERVLQRVVEQDKAAAGECVGIVARCLNEMMEQEKGGRGGRH